MDWLFGKKISPDEMLRKNQRALNKAMRDLDRERMKMEQQEKKIIADIKKMAKEGQMDAVKIMAKDLVRTRRYAKKFMLMKANIQAVSLKIQTLKSQNTMAQAMKGKHWLFGWFTRLSSNYAYLPGVTKAMQNMNRQLNLPQIQKILQDFEKQSEMMDMKEEMINDAIDDAMEDEGDEEETDAVVSQVLDELGLQLGEQLGDLPSASGSLSIAGGAGAQKAQAVAAGGVGGGGAAGGGGAGGGGAGGPGAPGGSGASSPMSDADADLQARLDKLRKDWAATKNHCLSTLCKSHHPFVSPRSECYIKENACDFRSLRVWKIDE